MKFLILLLVASCATLPEVPKPKVKTIADYSAETYPVKGWDARYSEVIAMLQKQTPIESPCQSVETFLKAIINAESSFNNASRYMEPAPLSQLSIGLFQLSLTDNKNHGCTFLSEKDIENPIKNIDCAFKIFVDLKKRLPTQNLWERGGAYWSVLRDAKWPKWKNKNQSGFIRFKKYAEANGCPL